MNTDAMAFSKAPERGSSAAFAGLESGSEWKKDFAYEIEDSML